MAEYIQVQESDADDESMNLPVRRPAAASADSTGLVKQGVAVADAAGDPPTQAEFNALLTSLRDAGIIAT